LERGVRPVNGDWPDLVVGNGEQSVLFRPRAEMEVGWRDAPGAWGDNDTVTPAGRGVAGDDEGHLTGEEVKVVVLADDGVGDTVVGPNVSVKMTTLGGGGWENDLLVKGDKGVEQARCLLSG
jgi:hypothetical protein